MKSGDVLRGVFRGEPYLYRRHWLGHSGAECTGDQCEHCKKGNKSTFRFRMIFICRSESGNLEAKIFENGWDLFNSLKALNNDYPLEKHTVKITRQGSTAHDTTYSALPEKYGEVTDQMELEFQKLPVPDLKLTQIEEIAPVDKFPEDNIPF